MADSCELWSLVPEVSQSCAGSCCSCQHELLPRTQLTALRMCPLQLSRELQDIMKEQDPSLSADAVDDDVYQWDVLLGGFAPTSPLGQVHSNSVRLDRALGAVIVPWAGCNVPS